MKWIDVHTHLNMLEETPEEAIEKALSEGVERIITIGTCPSDHQLVLDYAEKYKPNVFCTLGVHPHDAIDFDEAAEKFMLDNLNNERVVAVGEIGLDFYYDNSPREKQIEVFNRQMQMAEEFQLPVQIHTRDAEPETIAVLEAFKGRVTGIIHCFTGSGELAQAALDCGFNISISGVVTFKNADSLRQTVQKVPLERMHVETDAPFLTPVPFRGKKNTPSYVVQTAKKVAELKGVSLEQLAQHTNENANKIFKKLNWNYAE